MCSVERKSTLMCQYFNIKQRNWIICDTAGLPFQENEHKLILDIWLKMSALLGPVFRWGMWPSSENNALLVWAKANENKIKDTSRTMICSFVNIHQPKLINALFMAFANVSRPSMDWAETCCKEIKIRHENKSVAVSPIWVLNPNDTGPFVTSLYVLIRDDSSGFFFFALS